MKQYYFCPTSTSLSTCAPFFLNHPPCMRWRAWTHVLYDLMMLGGCCEDPQQPSRLQSVQALPLQPLLTGQSAPAPKHRGGLYWTCCGCPMSLLFRGPQTGCHSWVWLAEKSRAVSVDLVTMLPLTQLGGCCPSCQDMPPALILAVAQAPFSRTTPQPGIPQPLELQGALPSQAPGSAPVLVEFHEGFPSPHSCSLSRSP